MVSLRFTENSIDEDTEYYEMSFVTENGRKIKRFPGETN